MLRAEQKAKARQSLLDFAAWTYPAFIPALHLSRIAAALEQVECYVRTGGREGIGRLMVFAPPRHGKSELASIRFPAWFLGRNPDKSIIATSYAAELAYTFSRDVRNLVRSDAFRALWHQVTLSDDSAAVDRWALAGAHRMSYLAAGVGGGITGQGAHCLLIDDPVRGFAEAMSRIVQEHIYHWYQSDARTRLMPGGAVVLIMTRWAVNDLAGRLLADARVDARADQWEVLHLPAISAEGQALWPERYPLEALEKTRVAMDTQKGRRMFEALYQGNPRPVEGNFFQRDWFGTARPNTAGDTRWVRFWDLAVSDKKTANWTVGARVGITFDGQVLIDNVVRGQWQWPQTRRIIAATMARDGLSTAQGLEQVGFQLAAVQELLSDPALLSFPVRGVPVLRGQSKRVRAMAWQSRAEAGKVKLVQYGDERDAWIEPFLAELEDFTGLREDETDDQVDAVSGAIQMLGEGEAEAEVGAISMW